MTVPCGRCQQPTLQHGTRTVGKPTLIEGKLAKVRATVQRMRCPHCGHVMSVNAERDPDIGDAIRDAIATRGITEAAAGLDCDERTARRHLARWISLRESDIGDFRPRMLGLYRMKADIRSPIIIFDADQDKVVDITVDLATWLESRPGTVTDVVIGLDIRTRDLASSMFLDVAPLVPPAVSIRTVASAAIRTVRDHLRLRTGRRNFREDARIATIFDNDLTPEQSDELSFWSPFLKGLRRRILDVLQELASGTARSYRVAAAACSSLLDEWMPNSNLGRLLRYWGAPFAAGAGEVWADISWHKARNICRDAAIRHPRSALDILRATYVFT